MSNPIHRIVGRNRDDAGALKRAAADMAQCRSQTVADEIIEMTLKLVIGNKNYSSWSMRPWLALRANNIPFEEVFISLYSGAADKQRILEFLAFGQSADPGRWRSRGMGFAGDHRIRRGAFSGKAALA